MIGSIAFAQSPPDIGKVGIDAVKSWAKSRVQWAESQFSGTRYPSSAYWPGLVVYQIQVDRFNNGDFSNDNLNTPQWQLSAFSNGDLSGIPDWRHGGDLEGIRQRIPYLQDLGITAVWITPVLKHDGSYHGYCLTDPTMIDPGFGTQDEFKQLVAELHAAGIYVIMDIVVNHLCDANTHYSPYPSNHQDCAQQNHNQFWAGTSSDVSSAGQLSFSDQFFGPFKSSYFFNRCGPNSYADMSGEEPAAVFGDFVDGMFDFATRNYDFQEIFTLLHQYWLAYADIDGFRLDAAKHVTEDFTAYFSTTIRDYALSLGKTDFFVVGEVAASSDWEGHRLGRMFTNPSNPDDHGTIPLGAIQRIKSIESVYLKHPTRKYPGLTSIYDFNESGRSKDLFMSKQPPSWITAYFSGSDFATVAGQIDDPKVFWTLLEIHDWPRFLQDTPTDGGRAYVGLGYMLSMQGMPIIYYGLEQGFNGNCDYGKISAGSGSDAIRSSCSGSGDARKRQDMFMSGPYRLQSAIPEISNLAFIGNASHQVASTWSADPMLATDHYLYQHARRMALTRNSCGTMIWGSTVFRSMGSNIDDLIAFSRLDSSREIVILINPKNQGITVNQIQIDNSLNYNMQGQKYFDLLDQSKIGYVGYENGQAFLYLNNNSGASQLGSRSVSIFIHEQFRGDFNTVTQSHMCRPSNANDIPLPSPSPVPSMII
jgi:glycosidase